MTTTPIKSKRFRVFVDACNVMIADENDEEIARVWGDKAWDVARLFAASADMARRLEQLSKVLKKSGLGEFAHGIDDILYAARWMDGQTK